MNHRWLHWWWLILIIPVVIGVTRLRFDVEVLDLLPTDIGSVQGLKTYQEHFANARELIITLAASDRERASAAAQSIAEKLRAETNLIAEVTWQPPWLEHPEQTAELIAYLWFNQPPAEFRQLADGLAVTNLAAILTATREKLAMTLSPEEIARLSYDPFGLTRLPENVATAAPGFAQGEELFASGDGTFRILFVKARHELPGYGECAAWLEAVKSIAASASATAPNDSLRLGYTGRPAFVAEISTSMKRDIILSVVGTSVIIAILFWLAHRRWKPMLWLLTLLALILGGTLALGGLLFGTINVVSMGFAAILLGLAVDYAVVHYQEALAHPDLSVPQIRGAIAPSIFWAAVTTITAFLVLNFGGLPGLAQLGSLVGVGVALSALVMIFAFLPPLFPDRMRPPTSRPVLATDGLGDSRMEAQSGAADSHKIAERLNPRRAKGVFVITIGIILSCAAMLFSGLPKMDATADALQPRESRANAALNAIKQHLNQKRDPLWLIVAGRNESEVARRLAVVEPVLNTAVSNQTLTGFTLPTALWPRPDFQSANRATAQRLIAVRESLRAAVLAGGFSEEALGLTQSLLDTWQRVTASSNVFWPTNPLCTWILDKFAAREGTNFFAVGFLFPPTGRADTASLIQLEAELPRDGVRLSGWELLGHTVLGVVKANLFKLTLPLAGLVLLSLWLAFRRFTEIFLSLAILLLSGLCLLAAMRVMGWSWNLLNLMSLPLILGTGVDYSIFMQLALRRHHGDLRVAHSSVGRALLLCGGTAVAGFGSLGLSSNAGMAGLGQACAVGIASNMLISVFLLPIWWRWFTDRNSGFRPPAPTGPPEAGTPNPAPSKPSLFYRAEIWSLGLWVSRVLPAKLCERLSRCMALLYWRAQPRRREVVIQNLLPVLSGDRQAAERATRKLFQEFGVKLVDLWRYEGGARADCWHTEWDGWEIFAAAQARGKGVLVVTPHLGNWEFGGAFFVQRGYQLLVLTQAEPEQDLTKLRQASRARRGIETLVVGEDAFAFIEIIKRLQAGATVALLLDRPPPATAVTVELFGRPFSASIAAAELARASGCALLASYVIRGADGYSAALLPEITYDRAKLGNRAARIELTQKILRAFEPAMRQYITQWYHFVPVWPVEKQQTPNTEHQ